MRRPSSMICNVINLPNRVDRKASAINEFREQSVETKFWPGIIDNPPFKGISKAHKQIIRDARNQGLGKVLIAEDDIKFMGNGAFNYFMKNEPVNYDIYFAGIFAGDIDESSFVQNPEGLTLYIVHNRFYETFLSIPESVHLDVGLKGLGQYIVCDKFCVTQYNGKSDNNGYYCDYSDFHKDRKCFSG